MDRVIEWKMEITRGGMWPTCWRWMVVCVYESERGYYAGCDVRSGETFTKERAHRKAARAHLSMERDTVKIRERVA